MASLRSIIENNNATFYNYRTGGRERIWPRILIFILLAPVISFMMSRNLINFINSINTVTAILLGFAFSVLFYIASSRDNPPSDHSTLEQGNREERLEKLSKELFHNVSYFVVAASAGLALSMLVIAPDAHGDWFSKHALPQMKRVVPDVAEYLWWVKLLIRSVFFFLIIEAAYTFARIVGRVNFLFEQKLSDGPRANN